MDDHLFAGQVDHVDGEAHAEGVDAFAGENPQSVSGRKGIGGSAHEAAQAGPVSVSDCQASGEVLAAGAVQDIAAGHRLRHHNSWFPHPVRTAGARQATSVRYSKIMAGPRVTTMMDGRTNTTRGGTILIVVLAACSSAR